METTMHFLLFYKIDVTDRYPVATLVCGSCLVLILICGMRAWGLL